jgi:hypothetical protein
MLAASAWATLDSIVGRALLAIGILTLAASVLRKRRSPAPRPGKRNTA